MLIRRSTSNKRSEEVAMRSRKRLITWFIAIIMVSSIFGFILADQEGSNTDLNYNEFEIDSGKTGYTVWLNKTASIITNDHPLSLEAINIDPKVWEMLTQTKVLAVTYNQSDDRAEVYGSAQFMLEKNLYASPRIFVQRGLFNASGTQLQSITCIDASPAMPVMVLQIGDETKISAEGYCIIAQGLSGSEVLRIADRIALGLAGVMKSG